MRAFAAGAWGLGFLLLVTAIALLRLDRFPAGGPVAAPREPGAGREPATAPGSKREASAAIVAPSLAREGRPFLLEGIAGASAAPSRIRIGDAEHLPSPPIVPSAGAVRFEIPPLPAGWHAVLGELGGGGLVRHWLRVGPPVRVEASGPSAAVPARCLRGGGFEVAAEAPGAEIRVVGGEAADPAADIAFAEAGNGLLLVGRAALHAFAGVPGSPIEALVAPEAPAPLDRAGPLPPSESSRDAERSEPPPAPAPPPVPPEVEREKGPAAVVALVLVLDRSGSMAGQKLQRAREAALACAETLTESDRVAVIAFSSEAEVVSPLGPGGENLDAKLRRISAGGGTRFEPGLRLAVAEAETAPASIRHILLLSDGMTEDWNAVDYAGLVREARARGITLSTVGVLAPGDRGDEALAQLARWGGGRFYPVKDLDEIPQVFTVEARRVRLAPGPGARDLAAGEPEPPPAAAGPGESDVREPPGEPPPPPKRTYTVEVADRHDAIGEFDPGPLPPVGEYVAVRVARGSAVPLRILETGDPLLALRSAGRGWIGAWCGDGGEGAFGEWAGEESFAGLWVRIAEFLRPPEDEPPAWSVEAFGSRGIVRAGGEDREAIPPPFAAARDRIDAWTWTVAVEPPLWGSLAPTASGRIRSTLSSPEDAGAGEASLRAAPAQTPAEALPSPPAPPARLLLISLSLLVFAEALLRLRGQGSGYRPLRRPAGASGPPPSPAGGAPGPAPSPSR